MDFWPHDCRKNAPTTVAKKKRKAIETFSYPLVTYNAPNFATLTQTNGIYEWTSVFKDKDLYGLYAGEKRLAFPQTRPPAPPAIVSTVRYAEQGANFMRTYYPDIDVPAELIRELTIDSAKYTKRLREFDPLEGTMLGYVEASNPSGNGQPYIAFPMGELNRDLNLSPLYNADKSHVLFKPSAKSLMTFQTPILHISTSYPTYSQDRHGPFSQDPFFAVRTYGQTMLLKSEMQDSRVTLRNLATVSGSDVGSCVPMDIKLNSALDIYIVNSRGAVYTGSFSQGHETLNETYREINTGGMNQHDFWRIGLGSSPSECILESNTVAYLLDRRAKTSLELFSLNHLNDVYTSLENEISDGIIRLCTTDQIIWIDKRYPTKPLLGFKHARNRDYTLQTHTVPFDRNLTILMSRKNSMLTIYDVSRPNGSPISIYGPPSCLLSSSSDIRSLGQIWFRSPRGGSNVSCTLFQLHQQGNVTCQDFSISSSSEAPETVVEWSEEVASISAQQSILQDDVGVLGTRDKTGIDFSAAYMHLFQDYEEDREKLEAPEEVYEGVIDQAPLFWQIADMSEEHILTAHDILLRVEEKPQSTSNTDMPSGSIINSTKMYRAFSQGRLSPEMLGKGSAWCYDISPTLRRFIPEASKDIQKLTGGLSQFDLHVGQDRSHKSEIKAREQLALDMVLATAIYSSQPLSDPRPACEDLEKLTEALSLDNDIPPFQFSYLRPVRQDDDETETKSSDDAVIVSSGIHQLLKEWTPGKGATDHIGGNSSQDLQRWEQDRPEPKTVESDNTSEATKVARPPTILASNVAKRWLTPDRIAFSQDVGETTSGMAPSQEAIASTQIVAGPYGGRVVLGKKKAGKKRLGGF